MTHRGRLRQAIRRFGIRRQWGLLTGILLFCLGGAGDLLHHVLPASFATTLEPLLGADAARAHLLTFVGMVVILIAVLYRGVRHEPRRRA
jgi:hypothetical protein